MGGGVPLGGAPWTSSENLWRGNLVHPKERTYTYIDVQQNLFNETLEAIQLFDLFSENLWFIRTLISC